MEDRSSATAGIGDWTELAHHECLSVMRTGTFDPKETLARVRSTGVMSAKDSVNRTCGRGMIRTAAVGVRRQCAMHN
jgi:hypothetical protein